MTDLRVWVEQDTLAAAGEKTRVAVKGSKMGYEIAIDFYTQMVMEGRVFQVRAGTISVPAVGDIVITDTAAEMCVDALSGTTVMPVYFNISLNLAAEALPEIAGKSVATVSTVGAAFVPLNLKSDGPAANSTARVAETGSAATGVTVTGETAATTLRHFSFSHPIAAGAWDTTYDWEPPSPPILAGPRCFYVQVAAGATAGPSYFAHFDYIELPTANVD
jgi:hypothetical protein